MNDETLAQSDHDLLIRIDERTRSMQNTFTAAMPTFVTKKEFAPIRMIVYGMAGLALLAVFGSIINSAIVQK